jgi:uncharacterized membrane protein (DUF4010 family)
MTTSHYLVLMLIWLSIEAAASLFAWSSQKKLGNRSSAAGAALLALLRLGLVMLTVLMLGGCGGGDPLPDVPTPGVDCQAQPELCT